MVIWILDYQTGECVKVRPSVEKRNKYDFSDFDVKNWLDEHEKELGIRLSDCHWMVSDNDEERIVSI